MSDLTEKAQKEFEAFMQRSRQTIANVIRDEADKIISEVYTDFGMHLSSDAWVNYRELLRTEMRGGLYRQVTDDVESQWARSVRAMIVEEHKDKLVGLLNSDLLAQIEDLRRELSQAYKRSML